MEWYRYAVQIIFRKFLYSFCRSQRFLFGFGSGYTIFFGYGFEFFQITDTGTDPPVWFW
jgi:hypothetical protein